MPEAASSPENIAYLHGPLIIKLGDAVGASKVYFKNTEGNIVACIDSLGNLRVTGLIETVDSISMEE